MKSAFQCIKHIKTLYKQYIKPQNKLLKSILFLSILAALTIIVQNILKSPIDGSWAAQSGMEIVHKYPKSYDACFLGSSTAISNISNQHLYEKYGIASVSLGEPEQPLYLARYTLEEFLNYQSPKVVFLDTKSILYGDNYFKSRIGNDGNHIMLHQSIDSIRTYKIKKQALKDTATIIGDIDKWNYYSPLYYSHTNWKNLSYEHFKKPDKPDYMNGNVALFNVAENCAEIYNMGNYNSSYSLSPQAERYVSEMADLCNAAKCDLVLVTSYVFSNKKQHNAIMALSKKYQLKYIDINEFTTKTRFQHQLDLADPVHFNLSGSIKWSDFLGNYLQNNYKFPDRRKDTSYRRFEEQKEVFRQQKDCIYTRQKLLSATSFYQYLTVLTHLGKKDHVILISAANSKMTHLTKLEQKLLSELGLKTDLSSKKNCGYVAIISENGVQESFSFLNSARAEETLNKASFQVISNSAEGSEISSIKINGQEMIQGGNGLHFAVYNTRFNIVSSSCFFDINAYVNPAPRKVTTAGTGTIQYATEPNVWKDEE